MVLEAADAEEATQKLLAQGYVVLSVKKHAQKPANLQEVLSSLNKPVAASRSGGSSLALFNSVSVRETIFFSVQLSTLLKAGIPLLRSLEIIRRGIKNVYFVSVIDQICKKVSGGSTFSSTLRSYPKVFPWIWVNLVEVGEATGKMPECLEEIAHYQEASVRLKSKVLTAFFYPGILAIAVTGALTFLLIFIIPQFAKIFEEHHLQLPTLTRIVVGLSDVLRLHFVWVIAAVVSLVVTFLYTRKVPKIKFMYDRMALEIPLMGPIMMQVSVIRFTRSLGTLLRAGVQILQSLEISGRLVENQYLEAGIKKVSEQVRSGQGLGVQLESKKIFPVFMTQLVSVGEESGQLDRFLELLSNYYEDLVDTFLARLTTMLEPIMLVFMGGVIGVVVVSMFMPIIDLSTGKAL
jgi:type IV pilus assembly protein PilC